MDTLETPSLTRTITCFALNRFLERTAYYGVRTMILLYMFYKVGLPKHEAADIYGWLAYTVYLCYLLGGVLGLFVRPVLLMLPGALLQTLGCFLLAIPQDLTLYIGLILFVLGTGIHGTNCLTGLSTTLPGSRKRLDGAFSVYYLAINGGALIGSIGLGLLSEGFPWGYMVGFMICGVCTLLSILPFLIDYKIFINSNSYIINSGNTSGIVPEPSKIILLAVSPFAVVIFWYLWSIISPATQLPVTAWSGQFAFILQTLLTVGIAIVVTIWWLLHPSSSLVKLAIGFALLALLYVCMNWLFPEIKTTDSLTWFLSFGLLLSIAELLITVPLLSVIGWLAPGRLRSVFYAVYLFAGSAITNWLVARTADSNGLMVMLAFLLAVLFFVYSLLAMKKRPRA